MALQTEKGHGRSEQAPRDGTVGSMAVAAVFHNIAMLVDKRAALFHMAARAEIALGYAFKKFWLGRTVRVVTIKAVHPFLPQRVMGKQAELRLHIRVATVADIGHFFFADLLLWAFMEFMAVETAQVGQRVGARMPVGERRC